MDPLSGAALIGAGVLVLITWIDGNQKAKKAKRDIEFENEKLRKSEQEKYENEIQKREAKKSDLHEINKKLNEDVRQANKAKADLGEVAGQEIAKLLKTIEANQSQIESLEREVNGLKSEAKSKGIPLRLALPWKG